MTKSVNLMPHVEQALNALELQHANRIYRTNTIIQAAILALNDLPKEQRLIYLDNVKLHDKRYFNH